MARKALKDWTQADYNQFTPDEAMKYYNQKLAAGDKANAKYWFDQWQYHYQNKENEETKKANEDARNQQKKANDPLRNMAYGTAGASLTGLVGWGATEAYDAYKKAEALREAAEAARQASTATNVVTNTANAANVANTASTVGTVPSTPVVVGGSYLPEAGAAGAEAGSAGGAAGAEGAGMSAGLTTAGILAASMLADHYLDKQSQDTKNVNAFANPYGTFRNSLEAAPKIMSGDALSPEEESALRSLGLYTAGVGFFAPEIYNGLFASGQGIFGSSKGKDQLARDQLRGGLEKAGIIPDNDVIKFGDGSEFSMYKDGGARLDNFGKDDPRYDENQRHYYDVDFTNPESEKTIQDLDPLALALLPEDIKMKSDLTGYLVNAVQTGDIANKGTRTQELYNRFGGYDNIKAAIEDRYKTGVITEEQKNSALASVDRVMGYTPTYSFGMGA